MPVSTESAIQSTREWLENFVIGLSLCPFAKKPVSENTVRYQVCDGQTQEDIYQALLLELETFALVPEKQATTGLFICTQGLQEFSNYLDMLDLLDEAVDEVGLRGIVQVASFHPDYQFEGLMPDDPANCSNRSPYPMFHFIREQGLEMALASYPNPEEIPVRNERCLRELGLAGINKLIKSKTADDS